MTDSVALRSSALARATRFIALWLTLCVPVILIYWGLLLVQTNGQIGTSVGLRSAVRLVSIPALLGIGVWMLTARLRWPDRKPATFIATHLALGWGYGVAAGLWLTWPLMGGVRGLDRSSVLTTILPWQIASMVFLYGLIAGVSYAIRGAWFARDSRLAVERAERLQAQAELAMLRAHISPHFLFNTLHSVTQLLRTDPTRAEAAVERLSDLFRYTLRLDRERVEVVSLEEEWKFTTSYLWLEQMRMGERLCIDASLADDALDCAVPPFTLQPLIENAIRHGIGPKTGGGTVRILAHESGGELVIEVADDGVGAAPETLAHGAGIGIRAVRQRLEARHGGRSRADITGAVGSGLKIVLHFPAEAAP